MELSEAVNILIEHLEKDKEYRDTWVDNMSIAFQDTFLYSKVRESISTDLLKHISDKAANNFLNVLCIKNK